jgi:hypothetical protein
MYLDKATHLTRLKVACCLGERIQTFVHAGVPKGMNHRYIREGSIDKRLWFVVGVYRAEDAVWHGEADCKGRERGSVSTRKRRQKTEPTQCMKTSMNAQSATDSVRREESGLPPGAR